MNVLLVSPGFPAQMPLFTRGLAQVGATVIGVGDQHQGALEDEVRRALASYLQVKNLWDEEAVVDEVRRFLRGRQVDRVECLWEPGIVLAGRLREALGVPGLTAQQSLAFRDKVVMKQVLERAGVRVPRNARCRSAAECRAAAEQLGYPLIVKPIAGAGSADTYALHEAADLERAIPLLRHLPEVNLEEFIEGEEHTYDTVCAQGEVLFENVGWYRPKPLVARHNPWISPQTVCLRDIERPDLVRGRQLGRAVLRALGFQSGFTHMEWFHTPSGEAVFGEIGGRPPGGNMVHGMNYACDCDLFVGWAEAVTRGRISQDLRKRYNVSLIFKRAEGDGARVTRYEGLESILARHSAEIACIELTRIGRPRVDWRQVVTGDGWIAVRHPDLATMIEIADRVASELRVIAD